jgi:hypothetical protein
MFIQSRGLDYCLRKLHFQYDVAVEDAPAIQWWLRSRKALPKLRRRGFDSLFFLIGWAIWKERNTRTFNGVSTSAARLGVQIQEEAEAWCLAGYRTLGLCWLWLEFIPSGRKICIT